MNSLWWNHHKPPISPSHVVAWISKSPSVLLGLQKYIAIIGTPVSKYAASRLIVFFAKKNWYQGQSLMHNKKWSSGWLVRVPAKIETDWAIKTSLSC